MHASRTRKGLLSPNQDIVTTGNHPPVRATPSVSPLTRRVRQPAAQADASSVDQPTSRQSTVPSRPSQRLAGTSARTCPRSRCLEALAPLPNRASPVEARYPPTRYASCSLPNPHGFPDHRSGGIGPGLQIPDHRIANPGPSSLRPTCVYGWNCALNSSSAFFSVSSAFSSRTPVFSIVCPRSGYLSAMNAYRSFSNLGAAVTSKSSR